MPEWLDYMSSTDDANGARRRLYRQGAWPWRRPHEQVLTDEAWRRIRDRLEHFPRVRRIGTSLLFAAWAGFSVWLLSRVLQLGDFGVALAAAMLVALAGATAIFSRVWFRIPRGLPSAVRAAMLAEGLCPSCAYDLNSSAPDELGHSVCPECGSAWSLPRATAPSPSH